MTALKYAHEIKSAVPDCYVSDLYIDMHAFGKGCEDFYRRSSEIKTLFLMYGKNEHPGDPQGRPRGRLRDAHRGQREALRRGDRDPGRPGHPHGRHGGARGLRARSRAWSTSARTRTAGSSRATPSSIPWPRPPTASTSPAPARAQGHPRLGGPGARRRGAHPGARSSAGKIEIDAVFAEVDEDTLLRAAACATSSARTAAIELRRREEAQPRDQRRSARPAAPAWPPVRRRPSRRGTSPTSRSSPRSRGCWHELRAQDRRLPLQLVLVHRRRPGRHEPHPVRAQRARSSASCARRASTRPSSSRPSRDGADGVLICGCHPGRLPLLRGQLQDDAPLSRCSSSCWPTTASRTSGCGSSG